MYLTLVQAFKAVARRATLDCENPNSGVKADFLIRPTVALQEIFAGLDVSPEIGHELFGDRAGPAVADRAFVDLGDGFRVAAGTSLRWSADAPVACAPH